MKRPERNIVIEMFKKSQDIPSSTITEADLIRLPDPVQRYIRYTQILGKEPIQAVRLKQRGFFRTKPFQKWMPMAAEEFHTTNPPAFIWHGNIQILPLISISARDMFLDGHGDLLAKLLSFITLAWLR